MIEPAEQADPARLVITPEPSPDELVAIVAALRSRRARATSFVVEPEARVRSHWEIVARREAVEGVRRHPAVLPVSPGSW